MGSPKREWRHFSYEPKGESFTNSVESASSSGDVHNITLPQFSAASVPQIAQQENWRNNTGSHDFILFAGGNVWALDWCPTLCDKPGSSINCEYLAVSAHPPGSSYHKLGVPLIGSGIIQVWCLLTPFEEAHSRHPMGACNESRRRGRPRKTPDGNNSFGSSPNPPKPRGRPRKRPITTSGDHLEPVQKRPRGRPRKYPPPIAKVEGSSENSKTQDDVLNGPLVASTVDPGDLRLACALPTVKPVELTPRKGRGRPRKNPIGKLAGSSDTVLKDTCIAPSPTSATCTEPKRKRGRPRKYPVSSNSTSISVPVIEFVKDTTCQDVTFGCSLDHIACTESNANLSIVAVDAALPVTSSSTVICANKSIGRRGKGQPKKGPISSVQAWSMESRETISNYQRSLLRMLCNLDNLT